MTGVKAKKSLGQHFLNDENIACKIIDCILKDLTTNNILEVGPGMGVLTKYLNQHEHLNITVVEIDPDFVKYLKNKFLDQNIHIIGNDFLKIDLHKIWQEDMAIVGNFPYNISSQILFKVLDNVDIVDSLVRSEEHTSELQSRRNLVCRLLLEKKKKTIKHHQQIIEDNQKVS